MIRVKKTRRCQIKKDYQHKNLENPFFRHHNKAGKKKKCFNWKYYLLGFLIIIILIIYGFFASPIFCIREVNVSGLGRLPETAITELVWRQTQNKAIWPLNEDNIWLFDKEVASDNLLKTFNFSQVKINKKLLGKLSVEIEERPYAFIWQEKGKSYYSDSKGFIIQDAEVSDDDQKKFPIIENRTPNPLINNGLLDIDANYLNAIFNIRRELEPYKDLLVDRYIIDQEFKTVKVSFTNSLLVFFNINEDIAKQTEKLIAVKNEKLKNDFSKVTYVDLRYGDKVFIGNK